MPTAHVEKTGLCGAFGGFAGLLGLRQIMPFLTIIEVTMRA